MNVVQVENLMIGPFVNFNIEIPLNSFTIIAGSNNSGKSLLLKVLAGLVIKSKVIYNEEIIKNTYDVALLHENYAFNFDTVIKNIRYPLESLEIDDEKITKLVKDIVKDLKINKILDKEVNKLTYYEKIKVQLACMVVSEPKLLLLDDPCKYLSPFETEEFISILEHLRSRGITLVMATSSLEEIVYTINSTLYILNKGSIVSKGEALEVLKNDSLINKALLELPFVVDLSVKLEYYNLISKINLSFLGLVDSLWK